MKLKARVCNTQVLKILVSAKFGKKQIHLIFLPSEDATPQEVPCLVLENEVDIISITVSCRLLYPPPCEDIAVNYYLDFDASLLEPLIGRFSGKVDSSFSETFDVLATELEDGLSSRFMTGDCVTIADICIWCTLYNLFADTQLLSALLAKQPKLHMWYKEMAAMPQIKNIVNGYEANDGGASLENMFPDTVPGNLESPAKEGSAPSQGEIAKAEEGWLANDGKAVPKPVANPVLPVASEKNILITSALPYVNNVPHLGNIIGCVLSGDVFARYCRLRNYNTLYVCGTDEYGTATETKALEEKLSPKEICDKYFKIHDDIYKWFNIKFDFFGRTTTPEQTETCQEIFLKLHENEYITSDSVEQLLCQKCNRYLADRFVEGTCPRCGYEDARGDQCDGCGHLINAVELKNPRCKVCQQAPVVRNSKQFFLNLPKVELKLKNWMDGCSLGWSHNAREIARAWLADGLKSRCITRDLKWGIPVPIEGFENKVFYVWFDAPIGYISITKQYTKEWRQWWLPAPETEVSLYQFMAKDNVPFHSVMFPATLLGTNEPYTKVNHIYATEYLNYEDGKFSKSRGVGVFGTDAQDTGIPADIWRFYLLYVRPESQDSSFSWLDLATKNNSELLNTLGNFINRALMFVEKNYNGLIPAISMETEDFELVALVNRELSNYIVALERGKLREGIRSILSIARLGNQVMQASQPWVLMKGTPAEKYRAATVIGFCCNLTCLLSTLLNPYMPTTADLIRAQLQAPMHVKVIEDCFRLHLPAGHKIGKPTPLFTKIDEAQILKLKAQFSGRQKSKTPDGGERPQPSVMVLEVSALEQAVAEQGELVRKLKSSGKEKSEWQPEVTILMDLKKKLAEAQAAKKPDGGLTETAQAAKEASCTSITSSELELAIQQQGGKVRDLKSSGVGKPEWQPEVDKLLKLKSQLARLQGAAAPPEPPGPSQPKQVGKKNKKNKH